MQNDKLQTVELEVHGMTCNSCAMSVQKVLERGGAKDVVVSYATNEAKFLKDTNVSVDALINNIEGLGYTVVKDKATASEKKND
ncbi:MAG: cation transporter [Bacteroidota bacterium]|jgi:copper chaperone CopZ